MRKHISLKVSDKLMNERNITIRNKKVNFNEKNFDLCNNFNKVKDKKFFIEELLTGENKNLFKFTFFDNSKKNYTIENDNIFKCLKTTINVN